MANPVYPALNPAVIGMAPSGIREIMEAAAGRRDVIHLEVGEPDFSTPAHIVEAAHAAAVGGHTGYAPSAGIPHLREALAHKVHERNSYSVTPDQTIVTQGGIQAIYLALLTLSKPGDEILLPDPAWPNFVMMVQLLDRIPVMYPLVEGAAYLPMVESLRSLVTERTSVLVINSPSNPLGAVIGRTRMTELLEFADDHRLWTISDECYDETTFTDGFVSAASVAPDHVVSVYSFSKTYAMTGWRIGYAVAPTGVAHFLARCQPALISCVNTPTQFAALAALTGSQDVVHRMRTSYRERRDLALSILKTSSLAASTPDGGFFLWLDVRSVGMTSRELALRLLRERDVAVVPGSAFGRLGEGFLRVSLASSTGAIAEGLARLINLASA